MTTPMFEIATPDNTAQITLNDNMDAARRYSREPAPPETWIIGRSPRAVFLAVASYAMKHRIDPGEVGYSVRYTYAEGGR